MDMYTQKNMNMNEYHTEYKEYKRLNKFCQCFIENGKHKGPRCYKYNCFFHKKQTLEIFQKEKESIKLIGMRFPCRSLIKKEKGHGYENCGRINCKFHNNISDILEFPDEFLKEENEYNQHHNKKHSSKYLIEMYERSFKSIICEEYEKKFTYFIVDLLQHIISSFGLKNKFFCAIYIFHLISTPYGEKMLDTKLKFRSVVLNRIYIFSNTPITEESVNYVSYLRHNFTYNPDAKYILKSKNKKYNIFLFKLIVKMFIMYRKSLAYTYMPGGKLFLEAQERFYKNAVEY